MIRLACLLLSSLSRPSYSSGLEESQERSLTHSLATNILAFKTGTILDELEMRVSSDLLQGHQANSELQAILGGVLGFWGGVFFMGSIFLVMVMVKRCVNNNQEEDSD